MNSIVNKIFSKQTLYKFGPIFLIITLFVLFTFFTYKKLGITNDERERYLNGIDLNNFYQRLKIDGTAKYDLFKNIRKNDFIYSAYTLLLYSLIKKLEFSSYHFYNSIFSIPLILGIYVLVFKATKSIKISTFATLVFSTYPVFLGLSPINPVDIPFATLLILCIILITEIDFKKLFSNKNFIIFSVLGVFLGLLQATRLVGAVIYPVLFLYLVKFYSDKKISSILKSFLYVIFLFAIATTFMIISWPQFWPDPLNYFIKYLTNSSSYLDWNYKILYLGEFLSKDQRPWNYLLVLQFITYPITIIVFTVVAFLNSLKEIKNNKYFFLVFTTFTATYILYFLLNPVIYDGIRHFFFLLPLAVIIASIGFKNLMEKIISSKIKIFITFLVSIEIIWQVYSTWLTFPLHYIYFNPLLSVFKLNYAMFDTDYFSLSYKSAISGALKNLNQSEDATLNAITCDNKESLYLYGKNKLVAVNNFDEAEVIICDSKNLKLRNLNPKRIIYEFKYKGYPLNVVFYSE